MYMNHSMLLDHCRISCCIFTFSSSIVSFDAVLNQYFVISELRLVLIAFIVVFDE